MHSLVTSLLVAAIASSGFVAAAQQAAPTVVSGMRQNGAYLSVDMSQDEPDETLSIIGGADGPTAIFLDSDNELAEKAAEEEPETDDMPVDGELVLLDEANAEDRIAETEEDIAETEEPSEDIAEEEPETDGSETVGTDGAAEDVSVRILQPSALPTAQVVPCQRGDSGDAVFALQERLRTLGFMMEEADGIYGGRTVSRVKEVQNYLFGKTGGVAWNPTGNVSQGLADELNSLSFPRYEQTVELGSEGTQVTRLQRRLFLLGYIAQSGVDSIFGTDTQEAVTRFQRLNGLEQTGVADQQTQELLFSDDALDAEQERAAHLIRVDLAAQKVYAYGWSNEDQGYTVLQKTMNCTTGKEGSETPAGTYRLEERRGEWVYMRMYDGYARYVTVFNGNYYIHSVLYPYKDAPEPMIGANGALTEKVSKGSIRMSAEDAKWIYENCRIGTTIEIG